MLDYSGLQVQDARRLRPFPHQLRHLRGRLPRRGPQLFGREVRAQGPHARRRQVREQQGTEGTFVAQIDYSETRISEQFFHFITWEQIYDL